MYLMNLYVIFLFLLLLSVPCRIWLKSEMQSSHAVLNIGIIFCFLFFFVCIDRPLYGCSLYTSFPSFTPLFLIIALFN